MPTNLYGPGDNYDLNNSHVLPALIRKTHEAIIRSDSQIAVWGTGAPRREFLYSDDMADACLLLMQLPDSEFDSLINAAPGDWSQPPLVNIGCGEDLTVRELAETVVDIVGFNGEVVFDATKPDGAPRKLLDVSRMKEFGWRPKVSLQEGVKLASSAYLERIKRSTDLKTLGC
jgi:GDP-L-fucose synthase